MRSPDDFDPCFKALTDYDPFPWQRALFEEFRQHRFPGTCDIPTGLGKTSIMAVWLLALAYHARSPALAAFPRRLAYVVNRRTVVDQATGDAERMREALRAKPELAGVVDALRSMATHAYDDPLAISTLRGQFADNAEWRSDPARPAVILGTVDMIGSRLLFSGYGCGFKSRPLHAGFLGQDALLVHDEAHLEPAFQALVAEIESEQRRGREFGRFCVIALTATSRTDGDGLRLTPADRGHDEVRRRIGAKKGIAFHPVVDEKRISDEVVGCALRHRERNQAILVFLRKLEDVQKVVQKLHKAGLAVQTLTGTLRGLERDVLAQKDEIFARFLPKPGVVPRPGAVYLVCTSAGEVGVNISADHMICDLSPFDSMAQRLGRVNRFGRGDALVDVVHVAGDADAEVTGSTDDDVLDVTATVDTVAPDSSPEATGSGRKGKAPSRMVKAIAKTYSLLRRLPTRQDKRYDGSPAALGDLPAADRQAAFSPPPVILPASDILFDAWALTSIRERLPGRPPVNDWLRGVEEWEPPETQLAWREEVGVLVGDLLAQNRPEELLDDYPLKPHELLRDRTDRVIECLSAVASAHPASPVWVVNLDGTVRVTTLSELIAGAKEDLSGRIVLLPPVAGGLANGLLDGTAAFHQGGLYDVADWLADQNGSQLRLRSWDDAEPPRGMRRVLTIDTRPDSDDEPTGAEESTSRRLWHWYVRPRMADDDGSRAAAVQQELATHVRSAGLFAAALAAKLGLEQTEAAAVALAAQWHDRGKDRGIWQRSIGNRDYPALVLAKSAGKMRPVELSGYRHELGSLLDLSGSPEAGGLSAEELDLLLHLVAAHHGRARPHFPVEEAFDPTHTDEAVAASSREVPRRFARLQWRYGRWGLAYLESLVRAADILASQAEPVGPLAGVPAPSQEVTR